MENFLINNNGQKKLENCEERAITPALSQKFLCEDVNEKNSVQHETKVKFLDSADSADENNQHDIEIRYLTSDEDTNVSSTINSNISSTVTPRRRPRNSRRLIVLAKIYC